MFLFTCTYTRHIYIYMKNISNESSRYQMFKACLNSQLHDPRIPRLWSKRTVLMRPGHYYAQHVTLVVVYVLVWCALGPSW